MHPTPLLGELAILLAVSVVLGHVLEPVEMPSEVARRHVDEARRTLRIHHPDKLSLAGDRGAW
jgi:hypothetical protein